MLNYTKQIGINIFCEYFIQLKQKMFLHHFMGNCMYVMNLIEEE